MELVIVICFYVYIRGFVVSGEYFVAQLILDQNSILLNYKN